MQTFEVSVTATQTVTSINSESNVDTQKQVSTFYLTNVKRVLSFGVNGTMFSNYLTWADHTLLLLLGNHAIATRFPATSRSRIVTLPHTCLFTSDTHLTAAWPGRPFWQPPINCMEMERIRKTYIKEFCSDVLSSVFSDVKNYRKIERNLKNNSCLQEKNIKNVIIN